MSFKESLTFILPYFHGFGGHSNLLNENHGMMMTDFPNYLGCLIILLAVLGLWKSKINLEYKIFFLVSIIFAFSLSLGKYLPALYEFFYNNLPFFSKFRAPSFILIILQFSMSVFLLVISPRAHILYR